MKILQAIRTCKKDYNGLIKYIIYNKNNRSLDYKNRYEIRESYQIVLNPYNNNYPNYVYFMVLRTYKGFKLHKIKNGKILGL